MSVEAHVEEETNTHEHREVLKSGEKLEREEKPHRARLLLLNSSLSLLSLPCSGAVCPPETQTPRCDLNPSRLSV